MKTTASVCLPVLWFALAFPTVAQDQTIQQKRVLSAQKAPKKVAAKKTKVATDEKGNEFDGKKFNKKEKKENIELATKFLDNLQANPFVLEPKKLESEEAMKVADGLRSLYPYQSIRDRLQYEHQNGEEPSLNKKTKKLFDAGFSRANALRLLHSSNVVKFINTDGNGLSRIPQPSPRMLRLPNYTHSDPDDLTFNAGERKHWEYAADRANKTLASYFAGYGLTADVKSIDEVAGFEPHGFRIKFESLAKSLDAQMKQAIKSGKIPAPKSKALQKSSSNDTQTNAKWKMERMQLISLLKHDTPRVYKHQGVPEMKKLMEEDFATRDLNSFESAALKKLLKKEDVVLNEAMNHIDMVGAIRAQQNCLSCHVGKNGDLLGAFSYQFSVQE